MGAPQVIWAALAKWIGLGLAALVGLTGWAWTIRRDAKADARRETALQAAERYAKTRKAIDHADLPSDDPAVLRDWLRARDPGLK